MSVAFTPEGRGNPNTQSVQALLDENTQLIQAIVDYQNKGKAYESTRYQQLLHRNLVYLATLADSCQPNQGSQGPSQGMAKPNSISPPVHNQGPPPPVPGAIMTDTPNMPSNNPMTSSTQSYPGIGAQGSGNYGNMAATPSPPQLQHPPVSGSNVAMGYPSPSNQQVRSQGPGGMVAGMPNMNQPSQMPRHSSQMPQHMMSQGQPNQQYLMQQQQRQMQYRQAQPQQGNPQQQPMAGPNPGNYSQQQPANMIPSYQQQQQQQQQQRYNPYQPQPQPQQQTLSHMPYQQQQNQMVMGQTQIGRGGQIPMGQSGIVTGMSPSPMGSTVHSPMGQPPV